MTGNQTDLDALYKSQERLQRIVLTLELWKSWWRDGLITDEDLYQAEKLNQGQFDDEQYVHDKLYVQYFDNECSCNGVEYHTCAVCAAQLRINKYEQERMSNND